MNYLTLSTSMNPDSRSRLLAQGLHQRLEARTKHAAYVDLRDYRMPHYGVDGGSADDLGRARAALDQADGIAVATPIYHFGETGYVRNLISLTGSAWRDKVVGFLVAAGGQASYMSIMNLANSLMLDSRVTVIPRYVYATGGDYEGDQIASGDVRERLDQFADDLVRYTTALTPAAAEH